MAAREAFVGAAHDLPTLLWEAGLPDIIGSAPSREILLLVGLGAFRPDDPCVPSPGFVEALIDTLVEMGAEAVVIGSSRGDDSLSFGNRDVYALAELTGYRFLTPKGRPYEVVDLAEDVEPAEPGVPGVAISRAWRSAGVRINLARLRTDERDGYAAGLDNLLLGLLSVDKDGALQRGTAGDLVAAILLDRAPELTIVDASEIAHGTHGRASPERLACGAAVVSASPVLADLVAAMKLGADPFESAVFDRVARRFPLGPDYEMKGSAAPFEGVVLPPPWRRLALADADRTEVVGRAARIWRQDADPDLFPALHPVDAAVRRRLASLTGGDGPAATAVDRLLLLTEAACGAAVNAWRTMFDKDRLRQGDALLDIDAAAIPLAAFADMEAEIDSLLPLAASAPERGPGLRWRKLGGAVVFHYERRLAIPFERFVAAVDIAQAIAFMNDYLGGERRVLTRDDEGRPERQAERNLYLPQPNYLVLHGGKPIDVTKIETARFSDDAHALTWKTLHSANGSAEADDGRIVFAREPGGVRVTIHGRQLFTLPPFWRLFDIRLLPELDQALTTHAYQTFFDRTSSNLEALVEGRAIRLGRPASLGPELPGVHIERLIERATAAAEPLLAKARKPASARATKDADGFVHVRPG